METAVDIFTGFLDSGKTSLILDAIVNSDFEEAERTVLLVCEEGEEEYDEELLKEHNIVKLVLEEEEQFNEYFLQGVDLNYRPDHILVEYNGTWGMDTLMETKLPRGWEITGIYTTIDATTAEMYLLNMRTMLLEQVFQSDLVIINRCTEETDKAKLRRTVKMQNPRAQIVFEKENGEPAGEGEDILPFDVQGSLIELEDIDYGLWYIDALEHPERYRGKSIRFLAQVYKGKKLGKQAFVPGRFVMTCCEADIKFLGYLCKCDQPIPYEKRDWVRVKVRFETEYMKRYGEETPVLYLEEILPAKKPLNDVVTFS